MKRWGAQLSKEQPANPVTTYITEIAFAGVADAQEREYLNSIPTSLTLDDDQIDHLIAAGRHELRRSPVFQRLLADLNHLQR
jgi:hypothetical protein